MSNPLVAHPAVFAADSATPSVEHAPPPVDPTAGPTQLSPKHPNVVNYAISAGGVLVGVAFITTFALICRWRKRRRQRALEDQIDERIRDKSLSRLEASRTDSLPKLPTTAFSSGHFFAPPFPEILGSSYSASSNVYSVPRARQICIRSSDQHLSCACPDCVLLARSSSIALSGSGSGSGSGPESGSGSPSPSTSTTSHSTVRYTPFSTSRQPRPAASIPTARSSSAPDPPGRGRRAQRRTDENAHRVASVRTPPARARSPYARPWDLERIVPNHTYTRGLGVGIMVATTTGFLGCPSPTPTTPSLVFSTPRMDSSDAPSPVNSLSDDAGATTQSPMVVDMPTFDHAQSPATPSSVDHAASLGHLGSHALVHMHLSPLAQECTPRSSLTPGCPASIDHWQTPNHTMTTIKDLEYAKSYGDSTSAAAAMALLAPVREGEQDQKWFTDVDWYGAESPLACFDQPQSSGYASWGTTC